jgi:hypothetical protein
VNPLNGFTGTVTPTVSGLPSGATATFNPATITVTSGVATSTMTVATTSATPAANSSLVVTGTAGPLSHSAPAVNLSIQDFTITPPNPQCILAASSASGTITISGLNGFTGPGTISITGLPTGATASLNPATVNINGSVTSALTIATSASTPGGNYVITITVTSNGVTHSVTFILCVQNFTFAISPAAPAIQNLNAGGSTNYTVTVTPVNGFTGVVNLTQSGLPTSSGATATFSPSSITITSSSGAQTSILTVSTTSALAGQAYPFTATGTIGNLSHSAAGATLNVQNFTLSINPTTMSVIVGASTSATVTATPVNGYTGTLNCTVSGLPAGATATCPSITINGTNAVSATLTINTATSTSAVSSVLTVTYTDQAKGFPVHSVNPTLNTQDFALSISPAAQPTNVGSSATYTLTATPLNGFTGTINIVCNILPGGPTFSVPCPASITITNGSSVSASFTVATSQATTTGQNYTISATGTSVAVPALSHTTTATLIVRDFALSISPATQNVVVGGTVNYTVTATSINGFSGVVALGCTGTLSGANTTCSPGTINIPAGGSGSATLTVVTSGTTIAGTFNVNVAANGGGVSHSASATITVTDQRSLTIIGSVQATLASNGSSAPFSVTVNGFTATTTYCECVIGGQFPDNPGAVMNGLANAFNSSSGSPVTASLTSLGLTLTAKSPGVVLNISSIDGGDQGGGIGGLSFMAIPVGGGLGNVTLAILGSAPTSGSSSGFSVTVNGFTATANYCACIIGGQFIDSPSKLATALANAFNGASGSPVSASSGGDAAGNAVLILTSKTSAAPLTVTSFDGGAGIGGMGGFNFIGVPNGSNLGTGSFTIVGSIGSNTGGSPFSVSVNGFTETVSYCLCVINGQFTDSSAKLAALLASTFNGASGSPVTATGGGTSSGASVLTLTSKTPGAPLVFSSADGGAGLGGMAGYNFIGIPQQP